MLMLHSDAKQIENSCVIRILQLREGTENPEFKIAKRFCFSVTSVYSQ